MKVEFFGHNCFFIKGKDIIIFTDPWFTNRGAFFGSWFQWPQNYNFKSHLIEKLKTKVKTILYISHEHQDHFDIETLKEIQPYVSFCILPNYDDKFLYNKIKDLGYEIIELSDQSKYFFNEKNYIELMIVDTGVYHDSAAIINIDDKIFVNQNDCKIFDRLSYLEKLNIDFYAVQFSGASWHPVCYKMDNEEKVRISKKKVLSKLVAVRNALKLIKPKYYIPSAGPAVFPFLEESLSLGNDNIFVHQPDIEKFLKNSNVKIKYPKPGDCIEDKNLEKPIKPPTLSELENMRNKFSCEFEKINDNDLDIQLLINQVNNRIEKIKDIKFGQCPILLFDWQEQGLEIDLSKKKVEIIDFFSYQMPQKYMKITASKAYFSLMSNPNYRWQDIYLTLRATIQREPDIFDTFLNIFLFSDTNNIRAGFTTTIDIKDERIVIVNPLDGKNYEINRYCPHNGADLKDSKIDNNGNLICPRHSWLFNLKNEGKCKAADASINAKEIVETISVCDTVSARLLKQT